MLLVPLDISFRSPAHTRGVAATIVKTNRPIVRMNERFPGFHLTTGSPPEPTKVSSWYWLPASGPRIICSDVPHVPFRIGAGKTLSAVLLFLQFHQDSSAIRFGALINGIAVADYQIRRLRFGAADLV